MAVYERSWRPWKGKMTSLRLRFLVITRYALREVFSSRGFTAFYAACTLPTIVGIAMIYLSHNLPMLEKAGLTTNLMNGLTQSFFVYLFSWQAVPAFFVAIIVSPSLISADLANNALPMYLSRPLSRVDYLLGKMAVLLILISPITWMSGLLIFFTQAYFEGGGWGIDHIRIAVAYLVGHLVWIVVISLLTLAVSAWVRLKPVARGTLFGIIFILGGVSDAINAVTHSDWGSIFNIVDSIIIIVIRLFDPTHTQGIPTWAACLSLLLTSTFSLFLLWKKLRAHEVVS